MMEKLSKIGSYGGGWVLYVMIALSAVSVALMIERAIFFAQRRDDIDSLGRRLLAALRAHDTRAAESILSNSKSIEAAVLRPCLDWLDAGPEAFSEMLDAETIRQRKELERGMTFLGTLGNNAPFIGLLGTVLGVIQAFQALGAGGQNQSAMGNVMAGIAEALIATGVGLFVALPAVVAYNVAQKKIGDVEQNVSILGKQVLAYLKSQEKIAREFGALGEPRPARHSDPAEDTLSSSAVAELA